jgi:hypothetical protein
MSVSAKAMTGLVNEITDKGVHHFHDRGWGGAGSKWPSLSKSDMVLVGELGVVLVGV